MLDIILLLSLLLIARLRFAFRTRPALEHERTTMADDALLKDRWEAVAAIPGNRARCSVCSTELHQQPLYSRCGMTLIRCWKHGPALMKGQASDRA